MAPDAVDLLRAVCNPNWEGLVALVVFIWALDLAFSRIDQFLCSVSFNKLPYARSRPLDPRRTLYLLYCAVMCACVLCIVVAYPVSDVGHMVFAMAIFFLIADVEAFVWTSQWFFTPRPCTLSTLRASDSFRFLYHSMRHSLFVQDKIFSLLLKLLGFGVGATCGYNGLETVCRLVLAQQVLYASVLLLFALQSSMFTTTKALFRPHARGSRPTEQNSSSFGTTLVQRRRTRSCSAKVQSYPERCHVSVKTILRQTHKLKPPSPAQDRVKYLMLIALCFLYIHNQFVTWLNEDTLQTNPPIWINRTSGLTPSKSQPSFIVRYIWWQWLHLFNRTTLNLSLFGMTAVLLHRRAKIRVAKHEELLDLDVNTEAETPDDPFMEARQEDDDTCSKARNLNRDLCTLSGRESLVTGKETIRGQKCVKRASLRVSSGSLVASGSFERIDSVRHLSDEDLLHRLSTGQLKSRDLETLLRNPNRAVELRRSDMCRLLSSPHTLERLPFRDYDYRFVHGQCCEEVIGYVPIPVGKVGPLLLDGRSHYLPLATTEGCLVASTNRGCRAIFLSGGAKSVVFRDQMTRAPVVWFPSVLQVVQCIAWIESTAGFQMLETVFNRTSGHINLISVFPNPSGHYLHIRFAARTGDAMGMNMVSKATNTALHELQLHFPAMQVISLSGNMCTDKKPASINTILGRGKSVIAEACLPATVLAQVLHTTASRLVRLAHTKNWTGSAMAGCPGMMGSNAHAANIVAGLFAATGQDLAQVVDSSACLTQFEVGENDSLVATVTMPCIEVGTIGGGTRLPAQRACLDLLDLSVDRPTEHLARLIAGAVLAGELSLMAALDTDDLVSAHLRLNRSCVPATTVTEQKTDSQETSGRTVSVSSGFLTKSDSSGRLEPPHPTM